MSTGRVPPNDIAAEADLLGAALLMPGEVLDVCADIVAPDDFYASRNGVIWTSLLDLHNRGLGVDVTTLRGHLQDTGKLVAVGGDDVVLSLVARVPSAHLAEQHAQRVADMAARRRMIDAARAAAEAAYDTSKTADEALDIAESAVLDAAQRRDTSGGPVHVREGMRELGEAVADIAQNGPRMGITTGIHELDERLGGMHPGQLIVLAGRPSMGKSAIAIGRAIHAAKQRPDGAAVVFSLEMSREDCFRRVASHEARVRGSAFRDGKFIREETTRFLRELDALKHIPLYVDDAEAITLNQIRSRCRRIRARHGRITLVVVDYIQLMGVGHATKENRETQVGNFSRGLKSLAKHLKCPVLALAQVNRDCEKRPDKRPIMSDLRESGAIEQDADAVLFCYRDEVYNPGSDDVGIVELIARKVRNGTPGTVRAAWSGEYGRVTALERGWHGASHAEEFHDA